MDTTGSLTDKSPLKIQLDALFFNADPSRENGPSHVLALAGQLCEGHVVQAKSLVEWQRIVNLNPCYQLTLLAQAEDDTFVGTYSAVMDDCALPAFQLPPDPGARSGAHMHAHGFPTASLTPSAEEEWENPADFAKVAGGAVGDEYAAWEDEGVEAHLHAELSDFWSPVLSMGNGTAAHVYAGDEATAEWEDLVALDPLHPGAHVHVPAASTQLNTAAAPPSAHAAHECPICMESLETHGPRETASLSCGHEFCTTCIGQIVATQLEDKGDAAADMLCPLCRRRMFY